MTPNALWFAGAVLSGIVTLAGSLLYARQQKRKLNAEARAIGVSAEDIISGKAIEMYNKMEGRMERAEANQADMARELEAMRRHIWKLEDLMRAEGMTPPPFRWPPAKRRLRSADE